MDRIIAQLAPTQPQPLLFQPQLQSRRHQRQCPLLESAILIVEMSPIVLAMVGPVEFVKREPTFINVMETGTGLILTVVIPVSTTTVAIPVAQQRIPAPAAVLLTVVNGHSFNPIMQIARLSTVLLPVQQIVILVHTSAIKIIPAVPSARPIVKISLGYRR